MPTNASAVTPTTQATPNLIKKAASTKTGRKNGWSSEGIQLPPRGTDNDRVAAPDPKGQSWLDSQRFPPFQVGEGEQGEGAKGSSG